MSDEDLDGLAGEYVLGTLDLAERRTVAARRLREPALDAAILAWERRLSPLNLLGGEERPDDALFASISAALDAADNDPRIATLSRRVRRWQWVSGLAAAAAVVVVIGMQALTQWRQPQNFVALLAKDELSPAFIVSVNVASRELTIRPYVAQKPQGKSYELWLVNARYDQPRSLGVIGTGEFTRSASLARYSQDDVSSSVLAVSLEPEGGSPTGAPTGPVLFTGKLIQSTP